MKSLALIFSLLASAGLAAETSQATGAILRGLDKIQGKSTDIELQTGAAAQLGRLTIELVDCRYPVGNPTGDAFAYLIIREDGKEGAIYTGWMVASSPALNALDHSRYDVWVMRCTTS